MFSTVSYKYDGDKRKRESRTIIDYHKVLVLDKGQVVEYGAPTALLDGTAPGCAGAFRRMCEETGEFEELVALAAAAERARRFPLVDVA